MIDKVKKWLFEGVIVRKVVGKFVKHAVGAMIALAATYLPALSDAGITVDWKELESWAVVALTGLFGAAYNYIEHRFVKK